MKISAQSTIFVGRQPIYDRDLNTYAYELLYRSDTANRAEILDGNAATSQLLMNSVVEIGLENLVFGRRAFVNFTRDFLTGKFQIPFDPESLVIEVLEVIEPDDEVIASLVKLREAGFMIALDDYIDSDNRSTLLGLTDIVKIDLRGSRPEALAEHVSQLRKFPIKLLAEKVETSEEFDRCKAIGFDYFQGYFLSRPQIVQGKAFANNQLAILQLLTKLRSPDVTFDEVVDLVKQDVLLSLKLLRYVNSLAHGVRQQIDSVKQAAIRLGLQRICQIVTLIGMSDLSKKPKPLLEAALVRARMCELLAESIRPEIAEQAFTVGLFSSLDAFLDQPLIEVLNELAIAQEIREALLLHEGPMGRLLSSVLAYEQGDWNGAKMFGGDEQVIQEAYVVALGWAHQEVKSTAIDSRSK
jgi:EAL and modified HD-GYP domain-containing signal transduction protein